MGFILTAEDIRRVRDRISRQPIICALMQLGFFLLVERVFYFIYFILFVNHEYCTFSPSFLISFVWMLLTSQQIIQRPTTLTSWKGEKKETLPLTPNYRILAKTRYKHRERNKCMYHKVYVCLFLLESWFAALLLHNHQTSSFDILFYAWKETFLISDLAPRIWKCIIMYISGRKSYLGSEI